MDIKYRKEPIIANGHTIDIQACNMANLNVDPGQTGVGGDNSWGAEIHPEYRLLKKKYTYTFSMRPVSAEDDVLKLARERF